MPRVKPQSTVRRIAKQRKYHPEAFNTRLLKLLEEHNESYREAGLKANLDHQAIRRYLSGRRPDLNACILLADHFGLNPNELLELAGYPPMKIFDVKTANVERLPTEAADVAMDIARISNPVTRKAVAQAIRTLLKKYFETE